MIRTSLDPNDESLPSQSSFLPTGGDTVQLTSLAETTSSATHSADDSINVSCGISVAIIMHVIHKYHFLLHESDTYYLAEEVFSLQADQQRSADTAKCV